MKINAFEVNSIAAIEHGRGSQLEKAHDYPAAHAAFNDAIDILSGDEPSPSTDLQTARIMRDDGFTYVREYIANNGDSLVYHTAVNTIGSSLALTTGLHKQGEAEYSADAWRYLLSEHGATVGLIGRLLTVRAVVLDRVWERDQEQRK